MLYADLYLEVMALHVAGAQSQVLYVGLEQKSLR